MMLHNYAVASGERADVIVRIYQKNNPAKCHPSPISQLPQMLGESHGKGTPEEENRHRRCGRDMLGQTVPRAVSSNREGLE